MAVIIKQVIEIRQKAILMIAISRTNAPKKMRTSTTQHIYNTLLGWTRTRSKFKAARSRNLFRGDFWGFTKAMKNWFTYIIIFYEAMERIVTKFQGWNSAYTFKIDNCLIDSFYNHFLIIH